ILAQAGYHVLRAGSGADALALLGQTPEIALVVSDVIMPGMGGLELAKAAAQIRPDLSVTFMTGYSARQFHLDDQILSKPFRINGLLSFVAKALLAYRARPNATA
ncbi:MAG: response regulator, partial [Rhodospirillales bacterium]|nr:response regulator [Acetobacter sp.]